MCRYMEEKLPGTKLQVEAIGGGGIEFMNTDYKSIASMLRIFLGFTMQILQKVISPDKQKLKTNVRVPQSLQRRTSLHARGAVMFKAALKHVVPTPFRQRRGPAGGHFTTTSACAKICRDLPAA